MELWLQNIRFTENLKALADEWGCTTCQLALAWLHAQVCGNVLRIVASIFDGLHTPGVGRGVLCRRPWHRLLFKTPSQRIRVLASQPRCWPHWKHGELTSPRVHVGFHLQGDDVFPIPGSRNPDHVEENIAALEFSKTLTTEEIAELEAAVPAAQVRPSLCRDYLLLALA